MSRICIAGGPRSGKTTLAGELQAKRVRCTDDIKTVGWSRGSSMVANWLRQPGPWVIEGVTVARGLRKWLSQEAGEGRPCDSVFFLSGARVELTPQQANMSKGVATVWREIELELLRRGVEVKYG